MDIGGRKMAGFASGVVDSFQYYGTAIALPFTGWMIDRHGWGVWYPIMASFGAIGGISMCWSCASNGGCTWPATLARCPAKAATNAR